jgi:hypothetical protein
MATGKTNMRWARLLVDGVNLSGDTRQVGSIGTVYDQQDISGYADGVHNFTLGHPTLMLDGYQAVANDATGGSHDELSALEEYVTSFFIGIRAAPTVGDPAILGSFEQVSYTVDGTDAALINAEFGKSNTDHDHEKAFGVTLEAGTLRTAVFDGASVDNGASTATGGLGHLHVTNVDPTGLVVSIQDSNNDSDWVDLIVFAADGSTLLGERGDVAGTVEQYTRVEVVGAVDTDYVIWVTFARQ